MPVLEVDGLVVDIATAAGPLHAVRGVSFRASAARRCASSGRPAAASR